MPIAAVALDFDGTIATHGKVSASTLDALRRSRARGCRFLLVTGRDLRSLEGTFADVEVFDRVIVENGAVVLDPHTGAKRSLAPAPPPGYAAALRAEGVDPLYVGDVIVATVIPHDRIAIDLARTMGLGLAAYYHYESVMMLPPGTDKALGFTSALEELGIAPADALAIGDAENDHALLATAGHRAAVANAIPEIKARAHFVSAAERGDGVVEALHHFGVL